MKTLQKILLLATLTVIAFPLAAQEKVDHKAIKNQIIRAVVKAAEAEKKAPTVKCVICGKEMDPNDPSRRCDGDPDVQCVPEDPYHSPAEVQATAPAQQPEAERTVPTCPKCHEPYSIDEIYHGTTHECDPQALAHVGVCGYCGQPVTAKQAETIAFRHEPNNYRAEEIMSSNQGRVVYGPNEEHQQTFECPYCSQEMHQLKPADKCGVCHKPLQDGQHPVEQVHHCQPDTTATK